MPPSSAMPTAPHRGCRNTLSGQLPSGSPEAGRHCRLCCPPPAGFPRPSGFRSPACHAQGQQLLTCTFLCTAQRHPHFPDPPAHPAALTSARAREKQVQQPLSRGTRSFSGSRGPCHHDAPARAPNLPPVPSPLCPFPPQHLSPQRLTPATILA